MVASYGAKDRVLRGAAAPARGGAHARRRVHDVKEYPDAGHSFFNRHHFGPFGPLIRVAGVGYHGPSAEDGWQRILRFFNRQLRA